MARAQASTTEEPDAGKLHVRVCGGGAGQPASLRRMRTRRPITLGMFLSAALVATMSHAEIYRWTDENGKIHFSDRPAKDANSEKIEVRINTYEGVSYDASIFETKEKVVMYTASWCGVCEKAKHYFEKNDIPYKAYDVEKSRKGKADYRRMGGKGVPIILVGNKRMNGFSEEGFERLYE